MFQVKCRPRFVFSIIDLDQVVICRRNEVALSIIRSLTAVSSVCLQHPRIQFLLVAAVDAAADDAEASR